MIKAVTIFLFTLTFSVATQAQNQISGLWVGGYEIAGAYTFMVVDADASTVRHSPLLPAQPVIITQIADQISITHTPENTVWVGTQTGAVITGTVTQGTERAPFLLERITVLSEAMHTAALGTYALPTADGTPAGYLEIETNRRLLPELFALQYRSAFGIVPLAVVDSGDPNVVLVGQFGERLTLPTADLLTIQYRQQPSQQASRVFLYRDEPISFQNGEIQLSGILTLPQGEGPFPAIVLVHGAGEGLADIYRYEGRRFAQRGIAVLAYDKRGDGNSGGNAASGTLPNLAEDALAAVRYLQTRPEINSQAVGLWGVSQGGWIQPIAATQEGSGVAFLVALSPSGLPAQQQNLYWHENNYRYAGLSEKTLQRRLQANAFLQQFLILARAGSLPSLFGQDNLGLDIDPAPYWAKVTQPVLVQLGETDQNVPAAESAAVIRDALAHAGNHDYTIVIVPQADHGLYINPQGNNLARTTLRYPPGYYYAATDWILARFGVGGAPQEVQVFPQVERSSRFTTGVYANPTGLASVPFQLLLVIGLTIVFLLALVGSLSNIRQHSLLLAVSVLHLVAIGGFVYFIAQVAALPDTAVNAAYGVANALPLLMLVNIMLTGFFCVSLLRHRLPIARRWPYIVVALSSVAFIFLMASWQLIGISL
ncbi:MAG: alpha/beta fold hydrolase [Chloroflexi bacterium]|nr:alpha/beta fold hydrolase [Chloroflexota bacterium]